MFRATLLLSFFFLLASALPAQQPRLLNYAVNEGLASAEVYDVLQDAKGFMWFATDAGVSRYDGYNFQTYSAEDGLPDNTIFELFEDHRGRIWFISYSGLLSYYEDERIVTPEANAALKKHLNSSQLLYSLYVDKKDTIWYGLRGKDYSLKIAPGYGKNDLKVYPSTSDMFITEMERGRYFMTGPNGGDFTVHFTPLSSAPCVFDIGVISQWGIRVAPFGENGLAMCANELHIFVEEGKVNMVKDSVRVIRIIDKKAKDGLWFCMDRQKGVHLFADKEARAPLKTFLKGYSVTDCVEDREGGIWFSTLEKGVFYMPYPEVNFYERSTLGLSDKFTTMSFDTEGNLLTGTSGSKLFLLEKTGRTFTRHVNGCFYFSLVEVLPEGGWLVSSTNWKAFRVRAAGAAGLSVENDAAPFYVTASDTLADGRRYLLDLGGIYELRQDGMREVLKPVPERIRGLAIGEKDTAWLGGINGVWALPPGGKARFMGDVTPSLGKRVDALLFQRSRGILWMATKGAGIMLRRNGRVESYNSMNSPIGTNCRSLSEDAEGTVWVATNEGAYAVRAGEKEGISVRAFSEENGLPSNDILKAVRRGNEIWMLAPEGIIHFDIRNYTQTLAPPPVYMQSVLANGKPLKQNDSLIALEHDQNTITFSFVGLSFRNAGRLRYKYRLDGGDTSWAFSSAREAVFHRLAPGDYTFSVYACNGGSCSSAPAVFRFRITEPFWNTWWFTALICLGIAAALALFISYRIRRIRQKEMFNSHLAGMEMMALRAQMNPHFIFNAINSIQNFVLRSDRNAAAGYLTKFARLIRNVLENSRQELIPLAQELDTLRLYIELEALRFSNGFDFNISCGEEVDAMNVQVVPLILQPYAENAIRHGLLHKREKGRLEIRIERKGDKLRCIIDDDGIGREAARRLQINSMLQHQSMGLEISRKRLELLNQQYKTNMSVHFTDKQHADGSPAGTRVELLVPVINRKKS